jgi:antitoxin (DNA-binding transcriptional repressor) of toxin-antitoxin stability system
MRVRVDELRDDTGAVLARVAYRKRVLVIDHDEPVAVMIPPARRALSVNELVARRQHLPRVDSHALRADLAAITR